MMQKSEAMEFVTRIGNDSYDAFRNASPEVWKDGVFFREQVEPYLFRALRLFFDQSTDNLCISAEFVVHCFPSCPIPAGPLGFASDLTEIMCLPGNEALHDRFSGLDWFRVRENELNEDGALFSSFLRRALPEAFAEWEKLLANDPAVSAATSIHERYVGANPRPTFADLVREFHERGLFETATGSSAQRLANELLSEIPKPT